MIIDADKKLFESLKEAMLITDLGTRVGTIRLRSKSDTEFATQALGIIVNKLHDIDIDPQTFFGSQQHEEPLSKRLIALKSIGWKRLVDKIKITQNARLASER